MGRPLNEGGYKIDMSHQEMERLLGELEEWCQTIPGEWIAAEAAASWLRNDLGYEDVEEFEDALNGTFEDFLHAMPHIETKTDEKGRLVFKIKPEPPPEEWKPVKMTVVVKERKDLWNVLFKSQYARVEIPEMEFEISADGKRHIDSIYNHISAAVFNLTMHLKSGGMGISDDHRAKISECVMQLNQLLDVEQPFTWVVHDASGLSQFGTLDNVQIEHPDPEAVDA